MPGLNSGSCTSILFRHALAWAFVALAAPAFLQGSQPLPFGAADASAAAGAGSGQEMASLAGGEGRQAPVPAYRSIFPQIAIGGPWRTIVVLMSMRETPVEATLSFYKGHGQPWTVSFTDGKKNYRGDQFTFSLAPRQTMFLELEDSSPETQSGYAVMVNEKWAATGYAIFRAKIAGKPDLEAVVPAEWLKASSQFAFDNTKNFVTSVALVMPVLPTGNNPAEIYADVYDESGQLLASYKLDLASGQHIAAELPVLMPATANRRGLVKLSTKKSTDGLYSGLVLLFNPTGAMTTAPMVDTDVL